ncbi:MAG TPA: SDR family oxidoreductase [Capillimicrobium sp.]|jgi:NAD(P)-dependent dehydrogenase (short-subunit alcohol dehydrogenase family)
MAARAAIVTGASSGIGLGLAKMLGEEGHALTVNGRRPEKLEVAVEELRGLGYEVEGVAGSVAEEEVVQEVVRRHRERFGRLDVLVNNAGVGMGAPADEHKTKFIDIQLGTNLRSIFLFYREALEMLKAAGAEHRNAVVVNTASISGKRGEAWLSVYSATKHGVVGYTQAMNKELGTLGVKSTALCPAFVDTPMTDFVKGAVSTDKMITVDDVVAMVKPLLTLSPGCTVPEIMFEQTGFEIGEGISV